MKTKISEYKYFEVIGAGKIQISNSAKWSCGGKKGFSFGVEWGKHGVVGGVLSKKEAIKLAEHILKIVDLRKLRMEKLKMFF
jgi:hypothetical protein